MNIKTLLHTNFICLWLSFSVQAQLGISHVNHDHRASLSVNYEPYSDNSLLLIRYGRVIQSNTIVAANIGYSHGSPFTISDSWSPYLYTAGIESEYFLTRHIEQYPLGISVSGKYQYELHHNTVNESEHHFDLKASAYYPFRYKKFSISPYGSYGISDWSGAKFRKTYSIGGIISFHFSDSDYCYLSIYSKRYDNGTGDYRTFVSLGLLW